MANRKSTRKYNKLLTVGPNYYDSGGAIDWGLKGTSAPGIATTGLKGALNSGSLGGLGNAVGKIGGAAISGGLESGAGKVFSGLSSVASAIPGPWGAIASAGLGVLGGLTNRAFGSKMNEENIQAVEQSISNLNNARSSATSFDELSANMASTAGPMQVTDSYIGKDGWFSNKAKNKAEELRNAQNRAEARQDLALINNAEQLQANQLSNLEANYAAFGGPLGFGDGPIGYRFMEDYMRIKEMESLNQGDKLNSLPNSFASGGGIHINPANRGKFTETKRRTGKTTEELTHSKNPLTRKRAIFAQNARKWHHAFGGELNTHGADFTNGLLSIDNGGTHEESPFEGIPMGIDANGVPNLVEEGETIFNDYVFSNRLRVPKAVREKYRLGGIKDLTFADASKKLAKESEERPNDPISIRGLEALMSGLAMEQEKMKAKEANKQFSNGGKLFATGGDVNPYAGLGKSYNRGWFGDDGKYTQEYLDRVNGLTLDQLQDQFDRQRDFYLNEANKGTDRWKSIDNFYAKNPIYNSPDYKVTEDDLEFTKRGAQDYNPGYLHDIVSDTTLQSPKRREPLPPLPEVEPIVDKARAVKELELAPKTEYTTTGSDTGSQSSKVLPTWMRYAPAVGLGISAITDIAGITNTPDYSNAEAILEATRNSGYSPVEFNPLGNYLEYRPFDREFYINQLNSQSGATRRAIGQNAGLSRGAGMAAILAADNNAQNQLGNLARQAEEYNLAQRQRVEEFNRGTNQINSQGFLQADIANQRARAQAQKLSLKGQMTAAEMRERARLASDQAKSANLSGFLQSLGDIGRENMAWNWRNFGLDTGTFGPVGSEEERLLTHTKKNTKACGGKIKRRRKRGLTY